MTLIRVLLAFSLLALPAAAASERWTGEQKGWASGASAILSQIGDGEHDVLFRGDQTPAAERRARQLLVEWWGIKSKAELLETVHSLLNDDKDSAHLVWNHTRGMIVTRWGYGATLLSEEEAWNIIVPAAQRLQMAFPSWQELGLAYLRARYRWYTEEDSSRRRAEWAYRALLLDAEGPWRKYPWNLDLGNGQHIPPSVSKTAAVEIAAHPLGLMCVRITIPDGASVEPYEPAIEEAVGCHPRITGQRRDGPDLVLDTECTRPDTQHGSQVVADFRLEPIAAQLRREGVTHLISVVENIPRGETRLVPEAYDDWTERGWHWAVDYLSLDKPVHDTTLTYGMPAHQVRWFEIAGGLFVILSLLAAWRLRESTWAGHYPTIFWGGWIVVTVSFHGLAIAGFQSGLEGIPADIQTMMWYGTGAVLLRTAAELILRPLEVRRAKTFRAVAIGVWRSLTEIPFAIVLVLLSNPQNPLDPGILIIMLAMGTAGAFVAWQRLRFFLGERGGAVREGELHDAVFGIARRMDAPLRRFYILPEDAGPRVAPAVGSKGGLMIPERLLRAANRREIDGVVAYELMLLKTRHVTGIWATAIPMLAILVWRAYLSQTASSENFTLMREAGIMLSAFGAFRKSLGTVQSGAEKALLAGGGDAEGWLAGLARIAGLADTALSLEWFEKVAKRCGVPQERVPALVETGFPETGHYPIPSFQRDKLVMLS